ncbi:MAG: hypothetical protein R2713_12240 [Ilumatobacteraceae bacterium]
MRQVFTALGGDEEALAGESAEADPVLIWSTTTTGWWKSTVQHFTGARGATFEHYPPPSAVLGFSPSE